MTKKESDAIANTRQAERQFNEQVKSLADVYCRLVNLQMAATFDNVEQWPDEVNESFQRFYDLSGGSIYTRRDLLNLKAEAAIHALNSYGGNAQSVERGIARYKKELERWSKRNDG